MDAALLAFLGVSRLHSSYADVVTRMAWDELSALVLPDALFTFDIGAGKVVEVLGPDQLVAMGAHATASFEFYSYQPLNSVVTRSDAVSAEGRFYALEVAVDRDTGAWLEFYGVYDDEYVLVDDAWRFGRRAFRTLAKRTTDAASPRPETA